MRSSISVWSALGVSQRSLSRIDYSDFGAFNEFKNSSNCRFSLKLSL